eukprot:CAMPEP_0184504690 /NCGR_PEP_ID=MMETSP0113_2-20130426/52596_1 /TAXON_ID=91329 /ORGANISM="Norrisiella sphaerica, Strain BC52" /LENGTH=100 /DNA_ID=CAMNT_0026894345 /DNA_START=1564 /DNA_END=1864 /DNA_ORIENTATION=+
MSLSCDNQGSPESVVCLVYLNVGSMHQDALQYMLSHRRESSDHVRNGSQAVMVLLVASAFAVKSVLTTDACPRMTAFRSALWPCSSECVRDALEATSRST